MPIHCYLCPEARPYDRPFCASCAARVPAALEGEARRIFVPGQHATGKAGRGWVDVLRRIDLALAPAEGGPLEAPAELPPDGQARRCEAIGCALPCPYPAPFCREHWGELTEAMRHTIATAYDTTGPGAAFWQAVGAGRRFLDNNEGG